ncbi:hypothetical protein F53441_14607 [Fusarium austroafricanum]|uniref:Uncharacterized protein n=1 Tax=Fusarium austroafricanum TaxID=2364996 RepID=A0A8H4NB27_9HYPO|nr:hypothetical protein F53441_14607 [Fusarium austroafricanum]
MDLKQDSDSSISETQYPRRFRKLVIGLRVLTLVVTIAGIVVAAVAAPRSPIAIGILGPAFLCSVVRPLPKIRPSFSFVIDFFIALGSLVSVIWLGIYQPWWNLKDPALGNYLGPLATEILLKVAFGFGCTSTFIEIMLCVAWLLE